VAVTRFDRQIRQKRAYPVRLEAGYHFAVQPYLERAEEEVFKARH
jgi:hypothetical protein